VISMNMIEKKSLGLSGPSDALIGIQPRLGVK
jgi:hypothetical protein